MTAMSFAAPHLLWGLLLAPLALAAYVLAQRRRGRYAVRFTNVDLLATLVPRGPGWRRHVPAGLYLLALSGLLASLARPHAAVPVPKEEATVVMVLDSSGSMNATDVQPSRLAAARSAGRAFLDQLPPRFQVAVVTFASTVRVAMPPTTDRAAARAALDALRADGGTAMGDGIVRAVEVAESVRAGQAAQAGEPGQAGRGGGPNRVPLPSVPAPPTPPTPPTRPTPSPAAPTPVTGAGSQGARPEAILLLSDGANTAGRFQPLEAATRAQQLGIPVYAIALGTQAGTLTIQGRRVAVPPDEVTLRQIAEVTGGQFFTAPTERDLRSIYQDIGSRIAFEYQEHEVTFAFAAAGAVLLLAGGALALLWLNRFP